MPQDPERLTAESLPEQGWVEAMRKGASRAMPYTAPDGGAVVETEGGPIELEAGWRGWIVRGSDSDDPYPVQADAFTEFYSVPERSAHRVVDLLDGALAAYLGELTGLPAQEAGRVRERVIVCLREQLGMRP